MRSCSSCTLCSIAAKIEGPYVLAAHSLGGLFARLYASTYPGEVAGLVLVDAWPEAMPSCSALSNGKPTRSFPARRRPGSKSYRELEMIDFAAASECMEQEAARRPLFGLPLFVLSRAKPVALPPHIPANFSQDAFERAWREGQDELATLLPDSRHVIATESDHYIQIEQPDLVIDAVRRVVEAVRDPASWGQYAQ